MLKRRTGWAVGAKVAALALLVACAAPAPAGPAAAPAAKPAAAPGAGAAGGTAPAAGTTGSAGSAPAAPAVSPALQAIVDGARQEGQLTLVWGEGTLGGTTGVQRIAERLNKRYGLNLNVQFTPGPSMANTTTKLAEEQQANRRSTTDVMVGYSNHMAELIQAGALAPVDWLTWAPHIRIPELLAPDGMAVTFQTSYPGIIYNTQRVRGDAVPRSMADLLKPEYKGRVASTPYGAIFDYLATDEVWGEQRTMDYLTRFADQLSGLIRCNEVNRVASGEFDLFALACSQSNAYEAKRQAAPLDILIASDAPFLIPLYMAVPKNAPHPNAAKLWVDYVLSREVQEYLGEQEYQDSHLLEGSKTAKELEQLRAAGVQFWTADVAFVQAQDEAEYSRRRTRIQQILTTKQ
jgi:ABC-type Fe3+ transport system substrate-binding protein